jgi:hypothetical protein
LGRPGGTDVTRPPDDGLVYACLTHVPLSLELPPWVVPIYLGAAQHPGALNLRELAPEWEPHHPSLGSTAGAFALKNLVRERHPQATRSASASTASSSRAGASAACAIRAIA